MKKIATVVTLLALTASVPKSVSQTTAQEKKVWQIGEFDHSSAEFLPKSNLGKGETYVVGKNEPASWGAGQALSARRVMFDLQSAVETGGVYRLDMALLIEGTGVPAVKVGINGHAGTFYLHPRLDMVMGDPGNGSRPGYSYTMTQVELPTQWLREKKNELVIEVVPVSAKVAADAGVTWDALSLVHTERAAGVGVLLEQVEPTVFYVGKAGELKELVDAYVRYQQPVSAGKVMLDAGKLHFEQALTAGEFGEQKVEWAVPEWKGTVAAKLSVIADGKTTSADEKLAAQKKWTLYLAPMVHLDVGYTDYQSKVGSVHARLLDEAMDLTQAHPEFRFSMDAAMDLDMFMRSRSAADQQRVVKALQARTLFAPAQYCNLLTGFASGEALIRSLYPSATFSREHGTPFDYANITDVPSYTWSYASILASAGIRDFLAGSNNDRGPILLKGKLNETSPMWWEGPDGKRVLFWYARTYRHMQIFYGLPPLVDVGHEMLPLFLQEFERPEYLASSTILYGSQGENRDLYPGQATIVGEWNRTYAYPHMQYSGFKDAVEAVAKEFGGHVPVVSGDGGPYWDDGVAANPVHAAIERNNEVVGLSAEKLATYSGLVDPRFAADKRSLDEMWHNIVLYDEHTQVTGNQDALHDTQKTTEQLLVKNAYADHASELAKAVLQSSMASLGDAIGADKGRLILFNTLNWKRDGMVEFDQTLGEEVVDEVTGATVPVEALTTGRGFRRVRFLAEDVPANGYKVFRLRPSAKLRAEQKTEALTTLEDRVLTDGPAKTIKTKAVTKQVATRVMESAFYRVELDAETGAIKSLYDKELKREVVDEHAEFRFGEYVYVTGGDHMLNGLLQYGKAAPELKIHTAENGRVVSVTKTPYGWSAKLESVGMNTPRIATEIRLFEKEKKIEFLEEMTKDEVYHREGVYFAFPFAVEQPQFQYEIQNGVVDPSVNMLPGAGREWFSVQHWVSVQDKTMAGTVMPLDSSLVFLGDINRGTWPSDTAGRKGTIFAQVLNNYHQPRALDDFGSPVRQDEMRFRFVITTATQTNAAQLSQMGWKETTPLERDEVQLQDKSWTRPGTLDGKQGQFLKVDDAELLLQTVKPAEDGRGTILRLLDLGGKARKISVEMPLLNLTKVRRTDAVERDLEAALKMTEHGFQVDVTPHEIVTIRVEGSPSAATAH